MNEDILLSEGARDLSCSLSLSDSQLHFHSSSTHSTCASAGTDCAVCHHDRNLRERTSLRRSPGLSTDSLDHAGKANLGELPFSWWSKALTSISSAFRLQRIGERSSGWVMRLKTVCCQRLFMQRSRLSWKEYMQKEGRLEMKGLKVHFYLEMFITPSSVDSLLEGPLLCRNREKQNIEIFFPQKAQGS